MRVVRVDMRFWEVGRGTRELGKGREGEEEGCFWWLVLVEGMRGSMGIWEERVG